VVHSSPTIAAPSAPVLVNPENPFQVKALRALNELPPFCPILNRLLASLAGEDVSFAELGDLIEKDTVIAGNLLQLVNSALYARRTTVHSVRHAISVLGTAKLRNAVLGMSVAGMWNKLRMPAAWSMKRFNMHSAAVAVLSDLLAQHVPVNFPEGAFVAGLFHDLGRLLIAAALPLEDAKIWRRFEAGSATPDRASLVECEEAVLGFTHADLSAAAVAFWKLPWPVQAAVADHHSPWTPTPIGNERTEIPLGQVVDAGNQHVNSTGDSIAADPRAGAADPEVIGLLGLAPERLARLLEQFREEYLAMMQFFS
jgi:HD-like signal output (HDOD) protein